MTNIVQAYVNDDLRWVRLDRDILDLNPDEVNINVEKLERRYRTEKSRNRKVIGVVESKAVLLTLHDNNTFTGVVWDTRQPLNGGYTYI